jgi:hypothetical protein
LAQGEPTSATQDLNVDIMRASRILVPCFAPASCVDFYSVRFSFFLTPAMYYIHSASFLFTDYDIIWFQIHEMLRIEKGGDEQLSDELSAYESLVRKKHFILSVCKQ